MNPQHALWEIEKAVDNIRRDTINLACIAADLGVYGKGLGVIAREGLRISEKLYTKIAEGRFPEQSQEPANDRFLTERVKEFKKYAIRVSVLAINILIESSRGKNAKQVAVIAESLKLASDQIARATENQSFLSQISMLTDPHRYIDEPEYELVFRIGENTFSGHISDLTEVIYIETSNLRDSNFLHTDSCESMSVRWVLLRGSPFLVFTPVDLLSHSATSKAEFVPGVIIDASRAYDNDIQGSFIVFIDEILRIGIVDSKKSVMPVWQQVIGKEALMKSFSCFYNLHHSRA